MQNCGNCKMWHSKGTPGPSGQSVGTCRFNPPSCALIPQQGIAGQGLASVTYWTETQATDWCGKWCEGAEPSSLLAS